MQRAKHIAVIGGGPAGAFAAAQLAAACRVTLLDERLAWEKPCGGGITYRGVARYPFLRETARPHKIVHQARLLSWRGESATLFMRDPFYIYARRDLNGLTLERAANAGCDVVRDRVTSVERAGGGWKLHGRLRDYPADFIVIAAGARSPFRDFCGPLAPGDAGTTLGYYVPGSQEHMEVQFLRDFEGYIWTFPRTDHLSVGIFGKPCREPAARMKERLHRYMEERGLMRPGMRFYSHLLPSLSAQALRRQRLAGDGWAAVGDAAGLVDAITGEGIYYALRSADLMASCYLEDRLADYPARFRAECGADLEVAACVNQMFYFGRFLGGDIPTRMIQLVRRSAAMREIVRDVFSGAQGYVDLKKRLMANAHATLRDVMMGWLSRWLTGGGSLAGEEGGKREAA